MTLLCAPCLLFSCGLLFLVIDLVFGVIWFIWLLYRTLGCICLVAICVVFVGFAYCVSGFLVFGWGGYDVFGFCCGWVD